MEKTPDVKNECPITSTPVDDDVFYIKSAVISIFNKKHGINFEGNLSTVCEDESDNLSSDNKFTAASHSSFELDSGIGTDKSSNDVSREESEFNNNRISEKLESLNINNKENEYNLHASSKRSVKERGKLCYINNLSKSIKKKNVKQPITFRKQKIKKCIDGINHLEKVDFFEKFFTESSCDIILTKIFSYLSPRDIAVLFNVSTSSREAILSDKVANARRINYLREYESEKENICKSQIKDTKVVQQRNIEENNKKDLTFQALKNITNDSINFIENEQKSPPVSPSRRSYYLNQKEISKLLPDQNIMKCIKCFYSAKIEVLRLKEVVEIGVCLTEKCQYRFCKNCLTNCCPHFCLYNEFKMQGNQTNGKKRMHTDIGYHNEPKKFNSSSDSDIDSPPKATRTYIKKKVRDSRRRLLL